MIDEAMKLINRATSSIRKTIRRGLLKTVSSSYFCQIEGYDGEHYDDAEMWQQFGLASRPPASSEVIVAQAEGDSDNPVVIATQSRRNKPTDLSVGETCIHSLDGQGEVRVRKDGDVDIVVDSGLVGLSGATSALTDFALKGTAFNAADATQLALLSTSLTADAVSWAGLATIPVNAAIAANLTASATAATAAAAGIATYLAAAPALLSTKVKLK